MRILRMRIFRMRIIRAAAMVAFSAAFLAGPVRAQAPDGHVPRYGEKDPEKTQQQKEADKAAERAYQRSLGNITDKGPVDPWGSERSLTETKSGSKAETRSAAKTTKTATKAAAKPAPVKPESKTGDTD